MGPLNVCMQCGKPLTVKQIRYRRCLLRRVEYENRKPAGPYCSPQCRQTGLNEQYTARILGEKVG